MDNPDTSETINNKDTWQGSTKTHDGDQQRHMTGTTKQKQHIKPKRWVSRAPPEIREGVNPCTCEG